MSASAHTRGHDFAPELTDSVLAWLEAYGKRTVNGSHALDLEISKIRQYAAMSRVGIAFPETRFAVGTEAILKTARKIGAPLILKPNRGGKGLGVQLFNDLTTFEAFIESDRFDAGRDGTVLLQQNIQSADSAIIRNEFVGGKFLYAVRVDTFQGFELCPVTPAGSMTRSAPSANRRSKSGRCSKFWTDLRMKISSSTNAFSRPTKSMSRESK